MQVAIDESLHRVSAQALTQQLAAAAAPRVAMGQAVRRSLPSWLHMPALGEAALHGTALRVAQLRCMILVGASSSPDVPWVLSLLLCAAHEALAPKQLSLRPCRAAGGGFP